MIDLFAALWWVPGMIAVSGAAGLMMARWLSKAPQLNQGWKTVGGNILSSLIVGLNTLSLLYIFPLLPAPGEVRVGAATVLGSSVVATTFLNWGGPLSWWLIRWGCEIGAPLGEKIFAWTRPFQHINGGLNPLLEVARSRHWHRTRWLRRHLLVYLQYEHFVQKEGIPKTEQYLGRIYQAFRWEGQHQHARKLLLAYPGQIGQVIAPENLQKLLRNKDSRIREAALRAAGKKCKKSSVETRGGYLECEPDGGKPC